MPGASVTAGGSNAVLTMESGRGVGNVLAGAERPGMKQAKSSGGSAVVRGSSPLRRQRLSRGLIAAGLGNNNNNNSGNNNSNKGAGGSSSSSGVGSLGSIGGGNGHGGNIGEASRSDENNDNNNATSSSSSSLAAVSSSTSSVAGVTGGREGGHGCGPSPSSTNNNNDNNNGDASSSSADPTAVVRPSPVALSLPKPDYSGRLAAACVRNCIDAGIVTKYYLCPPRGEARKTLVDRTRAARERREWKSALPDKDKEDGRSDRHRAREEAFLRNPPHDAASSADDNEEAEGYSSGDDDDIDGRIVEEGGGGGNASRSPEPFFVPTNTDAASMGLQGGQVPGATAGRLPFNYRKLRYFDAVTAADRAAARRFLKGEANAARRLRSEALSNHLRKARERERERMAGGESAAVAGEGRRDDDVGGGGGGQRDEIDLESERTALATAPSRFPGELTPTLSAALLIESFAMNKRESVEGMAKCYDGIVSAGTALLDLADSDTGGGGSQSQSQGGKPPERAASEIMGALAPLLITTLEPASGEALAELSRLRDMCGTARYRRRFVQRIAPHLVRPPDAATWCLRHQGDAAAIVAAVETILDSASEVFSEGWHRRGREMMKESFAETLRTATSRLSRLNPASPAEGNGGGGVAGGLLLVGLQSAPESRARSRSIGGRKDGGGGQHGHGHRHPTEWEAAAIDASVRQSVRAVFSRDWGRVGTLSASPRESETPFGAGRRGRSGISTAKSKERRDNNDASSVGSDASRTSRESGFAQPQGSSSAAAAAFAKSPRSLSKPLPLSPRSTANVVAAKELPSVDALISTFGSPFESQNVVDEDAERPSSPTGGPAPTSPLSPRRDSSRGGPSTPKTPPSRHHHEAARPSDDRTTPASAPNTNFQDQQQTPPHASPSRGSLSAPLSPGAASTSSVGTSRSASGSSLAGGGTVAREQYRALTSTAAERKRTMTACRALRAQITQFEDAFVRMHGRLPKLAAERAPLASTYMQYREWKRAIRADAACRIQALCRGARARLALARAGDRRAGALVAARAGAAIRSSSSTPPDRLSIPMDMGGDDGDSALSRTRLETRTGHRGEDSVEVEMVPVIQSGSPTWRNRPQQRNQPSSGGGSPTASAQKSSSSRSRSSLPDVSIMSLAELQQRKRELKQQLKLYDMNFHAQHNRMPEKREKEPIRHLYESYNAYKNQISTIEKGEAQPGPGTAAFRGVVPEAPPDVSPQKVASPTHGGGGASPNQSGGFKRHSSGGSSESTAGGGSANSLAISDDGPAPDAASQDLASLKQEKATLHQTLRSYEKDFFKQHKRQVSSFADIRPVASQYRRYKEIKKAIAQKSSG